MFAFLKRKSAFLLSLFLIVCLLPFSFAKADEVTGTHVDTYNMQYLEITVPDSYIKLTSSLKDGDPSWSEAHIEKPSQAKDEYKTLNLVAAYFDPDANATVNFISKSSSVFNVFDISQYDDQQMIDFAKTIVPQDESVKSADVSVYNHPQMKMFRIEFAFTGDNEDKELIYGTIINGTLLQFSMDTKHIGTMTLNDDLLEKFVSNVHLTRIMTYEEYQENQKKGLLTIAAFFGAGILLMLILFFISKFRQKQKKKRVQAVSEELFAFRKKKQAGEVNISQPVYEIETNYDKKLLESYTTYNTWLRNIKRDLVLAAIYLLIVGYAVYLGSKIVLIIGIAAAVIILYLKYNGAEKYLDNLIKRYDLKKKKSITATYKFYDEHFTMTGIDSLSEYIYKQVFRVCNYQGYMLIYISEENALIIDVEKVPEDKRIDFVRFIMERSRID